MGFKDMQYLFNTTTMLKSVLVAVVAAAVLTKYSQSWVIPDLDSAFSELQKQFAEGGGKEHASEHSSEHVEKGEKGYSGHHEEEKGAKGYHDKERHQGAYAEGGGDKKSHHHDDGYYAAHQKGDKGAHGYNYAEKGSYAKGHNIKGGHKVHKLDEYKKDTEFYDEDHDEAHKEKHGGYEAQFEASSGGANKGGHHKKVYLEGDYGKSGKGEIGSYFSEDKGHKNADGHEEHYAHQEESGKEGADNGFKKWGFEH